MEWPDMPGAKLILPVVVGTIVFPGFLDASMTVQERQRLVAHLEMTMSWLSDEVSGLAPAQLQFRPAAGTWNILQAVEHLTITDPIYWRQFHEAMKKPGGRSSPRSADEDILWYGIDRTHREKAIPSEDVKGQLRDLRPALESLRKLHEQILQYAKTTQDDLRSHYVERQRCDAYQWLLLISTHDQRHILQIREIKANPRFPKR
jgi:hypothetical protein